MSIRITDEINMNYEHITSLNFELSFNKESIELWDTHQISRLEFERTIYSKLSDSIQPKNHILTDDISLDSLLTVMYQQIDHLNRVYQLYCDTIKSTFIKVIPPESIDRLVAAINAPVMDKEEFLTISGI
ncbi:MAG: hypothetical protein P1U56_19690, partial [Saprospiraceae bacterium]|nr:hypothetical protein [Saprospiraceae bacterium]